MLQISANSMPQLSADLDVDLASPSFLADPWHALHALQDTERVFWSRKNSGWIVTRHEDVMDALTDRNSRFSAERILPWLSQLDGVTEERYPTIFRYFAKNFGFRDGADHARLRRIFMKSFGTLTMEAMRPVVQEITQDLIRYAETRHEVEFRDEIAVQLPSRLFSKIIGIPEEHRTNFHNWSAKAQAAATAARLTYKDADALEENLAAITEILLDQIAARRVQPKDDLISFMVKVRDGGDKMSEEEMVSCAQLIIFAGFDTTAYSLTMGLKTLIERPDALKFMLASDKNVVPAVMEVLRLVSPVRGQVRIAASEFTWHDKGIRKGDIVYLMLDAANHDPRVFDNPENFDAHRALGRNVIFGSGIHNCLGQNVAKMELMEFFPAVFRRFPDIALLPTKDVYVSSYVFRGVEALPVRFC